MNPNIINLNDISKIPEQEFRKHFGEWLERDDVARSLQAKLRKDLIDNFNKTSLGKKIFSQHTKSQRLILSPLILALNTLVAEFLYAQNCHFSLSVFCTEIPYRNTLPDFESVDHFRFTEAELLEIFEAISAGLETELKSKICSQYLTEFDENVPPSLLYLILRNLNSQSPVEVKMAVAAPELPQDVPPVINETKSQKTDSKSEFYKNNFRYLNKYLIVLSRKVKEMSQSLDQMEQDKRRTAGGRKSAETRKFENLNRSLEKISETMRQLSLSKRKNKKMSALVGALDTMSKQFEKCAMSLQNVSKDSNRSAEKLVEKSYADWVLEMRTSKNGQKFLEKVESALKKTLERERGRMSQVFDEKLVNQKELIKLKYKQKFIEQLSRQHLTTEKVENSTEEERKDFTDTIERKLAEFHLKHNELVQRIAQAEEKVKAMPEKAVDIQKEIQTREVPTKVEKKPKNVESNRDSVKTVAKIDPAPAPQLHLQEMVQTIAQQERHCDHIVFDAKLRIQELEHESNQLDRSFQEYLQRQRTQKTQIEGCATSIWENYTVGKSILNKKCTALRAVAMANHQSRQSTSDVLLNVDTVIGDADELLGKVAARRKARMSIPDITIDSSEVKEQAKSHLLAIRDHQKDIATTATFVNPFRELQQEILVKRNWKKKKQQPAVHVIKHQEKDLKDTHKLKPPQSSKSSSASSEFNLKDTTLDGIELSPPKSVSTTNTKSSKTPSTKGVFRLRKSLFPPVERVEAETVVQELNKDESVSEEGLSQFIIENALQVQHQSEQRVNSDANEDSNKLKHAENVENNGHEDDESLHSKSVVLPSPPDKGCDNLEIPSFTSPNGKLSSVSSASDGSSSSQSSDFRLDLSTGKGGNGAGNSNSGSDFWS